MKIHRLLFLLPSLFIFTDTSAHAESDEPKDWGDLTGYTKETRFNTDVPWLESIDYDKNDPWLWLENDRVKVGVNLDFGGAICWISEAGSDYNLVNWHDPGRQVQTSYFAADGKAQQVYGGPGPEKGGGAFRVWCWNPVQAGDARNNRSPILGYNVEENHLWTRCQALNWGGMASAITLNGDWSSSGCPAEVFMDVDVWLEGPVVKVIFGFTYWGQEPHPKVSFEMPAVYVNAPLNRYWTYTGDAPWTLATVEEHTEHVPLDMTHKQYPHYPTEHWGAWLDDAGFGMTIYQPDAKRFTAGTFYPSGEPEIKGKPLDERWGQKNETHYLAGWKELPIDKWHTRFEWDVYLIVGKLDEARGIITEKLQDVPKLRRTVLEIE